MMYEMSKHFNITNDYQKDNERHRLHTKCFECYNITRKPAAATASWSRRQTTGTTGGDGGIIEHAKRVKASCSTGTTWGREGLRAQITTRTHTQGPLKS